MCVCWGAGGGGAGPKRKFPFFLIKFFDIRKAVNTPR